MPCKAVARFEFSPALDRKGSRVRRDGFTTEWWLILRCDPELGRYLRSLHHVHHYRTRSLQEPLWGTHVSVVRGEIPPSPGIWRTLQGRTVALEYEVKPQETDGYVWLPVKCEAALDYRESLGLPREPLWPLHLTIGNSKIRG
ncbi:MAG: hypothetical protein ACAI34_04380 [Verrucomicrobium sp.]